jgi:hypothetical protein
VSGDHYDRHEDAYVQASLELARQKQARALKDQRPHGNSGTRERRESDALAGNRGPQA